jgi:RNA polymerase sigma-70 factor (ECF subfamily)
LTLRARARSHFLVDEAARGGAEAEIRAAAERRDAKGAVAAALSAYGPEIMGYLLAVLRDEQRAEDVYSDFAEDVVRGLGAFRFESSVRTWMYTVARHACSRHLAREKRRRTVALSSAPEVLDVAAQARTPTPPHARTAAREGIERLRSNLRPDDQTLLILRVDRGMAWLDIARVLAGPAAEMDGAELRARSAKLRKRFERLKERLRALAQEERLLGEDADG